MQNAYTNLNSSRSGSCEEKCFIVQGYHGHLTSHNCVIDKRWVCKVTDYGLQSVVRQSYGDVSPWSNLPAEKLLWTAPELLVPGTSLIGTQPGDLYSFGVIVQEVITHSNPYGVNKPHLDPDEIITKLRQNQSTLKPHLPNGKTDFKIY